MKAVVARPLNAISPQVFTLPSLKPFGKLKLTAHEGARLRKAAVARFPSRSDPERVEFCLAVLTNQGEVALHGLPDLRRQLVDACLRREDIKWVPARLRPFRTEFLKTS